MQGHPDMPVSFSSSRFLIKLLYWLVIITHLTPQSIQLLNILVICVVISDTDIGV